MRRFLALAGVLFLAIAATAQARTLVVVQANVGNINVGACSNQAFKLCQRPVEHRAAKALRALKPDVVAFEEILPEKRCISDPSTVASNICSSPRRPTSQVTRLLGRGYTVSCDSRFGWECLAVRKASGARLVGKLHTRRVLGTCSDRGFTLNRGTLKVGKVRVAVSVAHPDSMKIPCRAAQLRDLFDTFSKTGPVLALGDYNLDPYRERDASVTAFDAARHRLGLRLASGRAISLRPGSSMTDVSGTKLDDGKLTFPKPFGGRTIDHVLVRRFAGACRVHRIDGGGGMDHRAQVCRLRLR